MRLTRTLVACLAASVAADVSLSGPDSNLLRNEERFEADIGHEDSVIIEKKTDDGAKGDDVQLLSDTTDADSASASNLETGAGENEGEVITDGAAGTAEKPLELGAKGAEGEGSSQDPQGVMDEIGGEDATDPIQSQSSGASDDGTGVSQSGSGTGAGSGSGSSSVDGPSASGSDGATDVGAPEQVDGEVATKMDDDGSASSQLEVDSAGADGARQQQEQQQAGADGEGADMDIQLEDASTTTEAETETTSAELSDNTASSFMESGDKSGEGEQYVDGYRQAILNTQYNNGLHEAPHFVDPYSFKQTAQNQQAPGGAATTAPAERTAQPGVTPAPTAEGVTNTGVNGVVESEKKLSGADGVQTDEGGLPVAPSANATATLTTYCILYKDASYLCPNLRQREKIIEHITLRQVVRSICISVIAFLCVMGQTITNWWRRAIQNKRHEYLFLYDGLVKQTCVIGVIFMFMSFVEHFGLFEEAQVDVFGKQAKRLNLKRHAIGDLREGEVYPEIWLIMDDCLLLLACLLPGFIGMSLIIGSNINKILETWRSWEIGGLDEKLIAYDESCKNPGSYFWIRMQYALLRRSYTHPRNVYFDYPCVTKKLQVPKHDFLLYMYLREVMGYVAQEVIAFPVFGLNMILIGMLFLMLFPMKQQMSVTMLLTNTAVSSVVQLVIAILVDMQIQNIVHQMTPGRKYFVWLLQNDGPEGAKKVPKGLRPAFKQASLKQADSRSKMTLFWFGTFKPNRQEVLWPRWRNGPDFLIGIVCHTLFFQTINLGYAIFQIVKDPSLLERLEIVLISTIILTMCYVTCSIYIPSCIQYFTIASQTDSMTNVPEMEKACEKMANYAESRTQELLSALQMHHIHKSFKVEHGIMKEQFLKKFPLAFATQEANVVKEIYDAHISNVYKGLTDGEADVMLDILGYAAPGEDMRLWKETFQIREGGFLTLDEMKCLIFARYYALHAAMNLEDIYVILLSFVDPSEQDVLEGVQEEEIIYNKHVALLYMSVGFEQADADELAMQTCANCNLYFEQGPGLYIQIDADDMSNISAKLKELQVDGGDKHRNKADQLGAGGGAGDLATSLVPADTELTSDEEDDEPAGNKAAFASYKINADGTMEEKAETNSNKKIVVGHRRKLKPNQVRAKELAYYMFDKQKHRNV